MSKIYKKKTVVRDRKKIMQVIYLKINLKKISNLINEKWKNVLRKNYSLETQQIQKERRKDMCEKYKNNVNNVKKIRSRNKRFYIIETFNEILSIFLSL